VSSPLWSTSRRSNSASMNRMNSCRDTFPFL
jgi:hypothetical protein